MSFTEASASSPHKATTSPIVTGTSVLALRYRDGVMMIADTLGSYGGLAMFKAMPRIFAINEQTMLGAGGEQSDLQFVIKNLESLVRHDFVSDDGSTLTPPELHSYISRVMYNRRSKVDPLWNTVLVAGRSFLGCVDLYGSAYTADQLATGYGQHLALPLLRKHASNDMSYESAKQLLEDCQRVLIYRDCRTMNSFTLGTITKDGVNITAPYSVETQWEFKRFVQPDLA